jgi:hypothetical protein
MNCKHCSGLCWHPNKGFYCTVPNCNPTTSVDDVREIYERAYGKIEKGGKQNHERQQKSTSSQP